MTATPSPVAAAIIGPARCPCCGASWQASAPANTRRLECPQCHLMTGFQIGRAESEACGSCGHWAFIMTADAVRCARCDSVVAHAVNWYDDP